VTITGESDRADFDQEDTMAQHEENARGARIADVMVENVVTIDATANLVEVARAMREANVGMLPVMDGGNLLGVVTDRDLVLRAMAEDVKPSSLQVSECMSTNVIAVPRRSRTTRWRLPRRCHGARRVWPSRRRPPRQPRRPHITLLRENQIFLDAKRPSVATSRDLTAELLGDCPLELGDRGRPLRGGRRLAGDVVEQPVDRVVADLGLVDSLADGAYGRTFPFQGIVDAARRRSRPSTRAGHPLGVGRASSANIRVSAA
jgi:CBS domain-containing protein